MSAAVRYEELHSFIKEVYCKTSERIDMDNAEAVMLLYAILRKAKELEDRDYNKSLAEAGY